MSDGKIMSIKETVSDHLNNWDSSLISIMKGSTKGESIISYINIDLLMDNTLNEGREITEEAVNAMVSSILKGGLQQPIIVAPNENGTYRKISGHIRTRAIRRIFNSKQSYRFGNKMLQYEVPCIILEFDNISEEKMAVLIGNIRNDDSKEERIRRTKEASELYEELKEQNKDINPNKLNWLSEMTGYSRASIARYLQDNKKPISRPKENPYEMVEEILSETLNEDVKISKSSIKICFDDKEDLIRVLSEFQLINDRMKEITSYLE